MTATARPHHVDRWFYISMALLLLLLTVAAFGPSLLDPSRRTVPLPLTPLVTAHAIVSAAWLLLFLTQATLVVTGCTAVHRRVGIFGAVLTVVFVVLGVFTVIAQARRGFDLSGDISRLPPRPGAPPDPAAAVVGLLFLFLTFAILIGAGLGGRLANYLGSTADIISSVISHNLALGGEGNGGSGGPTLANLGAGGGIFNAFGNFAFDTGDVLPPASSM